MPGGVEALVAHGRELDGLLQAQIVCCTAVLGIGLRGARLLSRGRLEGVTNRRKEFGGICGAAVELEHRSDHQVKPVAHEKSRDRLDGIRQRPSHDPRADAVIVEDRPERPHAPGGGRIRLAADDSETHQNV